MADLIFRLVFAVFQHLLVAELRKIGILVVLKRRGSTLFPGSGVAAEAPVDFVPPTYMDDVAVPVIATDCLALLERTEIVASLLVQLAASFGLRLYFGPDKTAALLILVGHKAKAAKEALVAVEVDGTPCLDLAGGGSLRVVQMYNTWAPD